MTELHSWLCNGLGERLAATAATLPEPGGLFATLAGAQAIADAANHLIGRNDGQYSSWFPVALIRTQADGVRPH